MGYHYNKEGLAILEKNLECGCNKYGEDVFLAMQTQPMLHLTHVMDTKEAEGDICLKPSYLKFSNLS